MPRPAQLRVVRLAPDDGFYLLYCDADGRELTDTHHDSLESAFAQAEWEFGVKRAEWHLVTTG
jgi:hypothetical protein